MESISVRDRRTPFLKRENITLRYKAKTPVTKAAPATPSVNNFVKKPDAVIPPKQADKAIAQNEMSSFWL